LTLRQKMKALGRMLQDAGRAVARNEGRVTCYVHLDLKDGGGGSHCGYYSTAGLGDVFRGLIIAAREHNEGGTCPGCTAVLEAMEAASTAFEASVAKAGALNTREHLH
jgi:hypothetical protein